MTIKEAIESISEGNSLISLVAEECLKSLEAMTYFSHDIADQYVAGCGGSMSATHGHEVISTIINFSDAIKIHQMENRQGLAEILSNPISLN